MLLQHLQAAGFPGAPRVLGVDAEGREVLSYVEGEAASGKPPSYVWHDRVLVALARQIRTFHDAAAALADHNLPWASAPLAGHPVETICHNDIAPWNTVFSVRTPIALIDWDFAGPERAAGTSRMRCGTSYRSTRAGVASTWALRSGHDC